MLGKFTLFNCEVEIDRNKTKQWYAQAQEWGCDCADCRNFLALANSNALPHTITEQLHLLEIPPEKATYVCHLTDYENKHLYQFSYRIAGKILNEVTNHYTGPGHCCHEPYPYGAPDFPQPHFDLEFFIELPWVLTKKRGET